MDSLLSGAIIYEWTQEANNYGIVLYPNRAIQNGVTVPVGQPIPMQPEFDNLKSAWAAVSPTIVSLAAYSPSTVVMPCPATTPGVWTIVGNATLPETPGSLTPELASSYKFSGTLSTVAVNTVGTNVGTGLIQSGGVASMTNDAGATTATGTASALRSSSTCTTFSFISANL
jgi:1,3-beta-glucanosyltransferase GAS1